MTGSEVSVLPEAREPKHLPLQVTLIIQVLLKYLWELPFVTIIYDIGGGLKGGVGFKGVQIGGPSGGCLD